VIDVDGQEVCKNAEAGVIDESRTLNGNKSEYDEEEEDDEEYDDDDEEDEEDYEDDENEEDEGEDYEDEEEEVPVNTVTKEDNKAKSKGGYIEFASIGYNKDEEDCSDADKHFCDHHINNHEDVAKTCLRHWTAAQTKCRESCMLCDNQEHMGTLKTAVSNVFSNVPQIAEGDKYEETLEVIAKSEDYMYNKFYPVTKTNGVKKEDCKNRNALCSFWASVGECESNPPYMKFECAPACRTCEDLSFEARCPMNDTLASAWNPGDLDKMFYRIATDEEFKKYTPIIYSAPDKYVGQFTNATYTPLTGPWVVVLDNFLTPEECQRFIDLGALKGYEQSMDVGERKYDGTYGSLKSDSRTSHNAWCTEDCYTDPVSTDVHERMHNLIQIPTENYEYLQLLRYEVGQFYAQHHDYIPHQLKRPTGVRILTVFLYLNDVEAGGGTNFPRLNDLVSVDMIELIYGCTHVWMYGCMVVWLCGCVVVWMCEDESGDVVEH
jgi:2OG-Fe(II) oxygenase superfamily/ShK domain-like